jgi:phosphohistidine phosphatase
MAVRAARAWCRSAGVFDDRAYQASARQLLDLIRRAPTAARTLLVVGHDPAIPELAVMLAAPAPPGEAGAAGDVAEPAMAGRMRAKFPTAAVAVFEFTGRREMGSARPGLARLIRFMTPSELRAPGRPGADAR